MPEKWAIQDPDLDVYVADEQYTTGMVTVATESGSSSYNPRKFASAEAAEKYLKHLLDHNASARKTKWKVVAI